MMCSAFCQQISFYASTTSYRKVLAQHGWDSVGEQLSALAARQEWDKMPSLVDDEILETVATIALPDDLAEVLKLRYAGLVDRITLYSPFIPGERDDFWQKTQQGISH